ncbi:hypothetical protein DH2020_033936 [Rehmannia glutinosa]|uniref:AAA+ ATPase domain-containing protein n=1 Tax=Rehmannia glutinosa TaxID=99300 RepID=A0ABR0VE42_REHGL
MEGKNVRRRLVQSTLFPQAESSIKEGENCDGNRGEEVAEEEQGEGGGSGKKRRESRRKSNSKSKTTPRASPKKVIENGKETSSKQVDDNDSPASERRQQKRQQKELVLIDSPEENGEICSPPSSVANGRSTPCKLKRQDSSTPRKEKRNSTPSKKMKSGKRESCCGQIPFDLAVDEQQLRTIPDLRLEAKLSSEDDHMTLSWGHWIFSERSAIADLDCGCSPVYEGSIDSLNFDNFLNISHFTRTSLYQNSHPCSVQPKEVPGLPDKPECSYSLSPLLIANKREICGEQLKDSDMLPKDAEAILATSVESMLQEHKLEENDLCDEIPCVGSLESELQHRLLEERIMSHYHTSQNQPENCLWTDKYQPQNAKQICGNGESVEFLSEWLHLWHKRGSLTSRGCINEDYSIVQDIDHDYQQSDSDTNGSEESLKNVLLVTGPVGSGKSAAIYACARDQGFQIIEINASDWRNGALVKQKFGEAVESHWLQRTVENATKSDNKSLSKFFNAVNTETHCSDDEVIELTHLSDKEDSQDAGSWPKMSACGYNRTANSQSEIKTLILFEDVDATVHEDQGFITTIQQLAVTAKRPMILTSNSDNPVLPKNLDRLDLSFSVPSMKELLGLVSMICAAEKANIHPCLIEKFVNYCQGDIRKTIMLLQFWCQGQTPGRGNELHATYWPLLFDLDAGHHILPRVIQWGYPSQLSELVADEIAKSLTLMEETHGLMDTNIVEDLNGYTTENIHVQVAEPDPVEVKKEAMLSFQCSLLDEFECAQFEAKCELSDFSSSPIAFARQNSRRKINTVLSSDSEDEFSCGSIPLVSAGVDIKAEILDMKNTPETYNLAPEPIFHSEADNSEDHPQLLERVDCSHIENTCISHDMSFVPESTFVPETEILHETELYSTTVSYGHFNAVGDICIFQDQDSITILEPGIGSQSTNSLHNDQEMLGNNFDFSTACVDEEEVGDSLSKSEAGVPGGYQPLDECSRMVFMKRLQPLDNPETDQVIDFVKETWKKLHDQCKDLKKYVTAEERTARQVLILAHGMSNLISEADLLLKDCQTLVFDSSESSLVPTEKTHSYTYSDTQLEMSSILAQHGMCCYAKEIASLGSVMGPTHIVDLASEMLSSSASSIALGKLASQDQIKVDRSDMKTTKHPDLSVSKSESSLCNIVQTIVPSRSYLAAKGAAFHEYISTLSQISRYESSRLSECINSRRKQRRARVPRHYLSSGSLAMSPEEISLLGQYNSFQKTSSLLRDGSFR